MAESEHIDEAAPQPGADTASGGQETSRATPTTQTFSEFAEEHAASVLEEMDGLKAGPPGEKGAPPKDGEDETPPSEGAGGDPLQSLWDLAGTLPEETANQIKGSLSAMARWGESVKAHVEQLEAQREHVAHLASRVDRIARHPRFQQALQMVIKAGGNGNGHDLEDELKPPPPESLETDGERFAVKGLTALDARMRAFRGELAKRDAIIGELRQRMEKWEGTDAQRRQDEVLGTIGALHRELDKEYPTLANDAGQRQAWHEWTATLIKAQHEAGEPLDLAEAMRQAARFLTMDDAENRGKRKALEAARKAAKQTTLNDAARGPKVAQGATMRECLAAAEAEQGVSLDEALAGRSVG